MTGTNPSNSFKIIGTNTTSKPLFVQQPADAIAGQTIAPAVKVQVSDVYGNLVNTDSLFVTLTLNGILRRVRTR